MISNCTVEWNSEYINDGLLFFAQRIVEMLDYGTVDIFRAPLMNTSRLINEYLTTLHGSSKAYHLDEIFHEFINSFSNDIVIEYNWGKERIDQIVRKLNKEQANRQAIMEYLRHTIGSHYLKWVKEYTLHIVPQNREKRKIERCVRCLVPELLDRGYSRDEIYHSAKQILTNEIDPSQSLNDFISKYNCRKRKFVVYIAISNRLQIFKETLVERLGISFEDDGNFEKFEVWDKYIPVRTATIEALDASAAATSAYRNIELFTTFYQFFGDYSGRLIQNRVLTISDSGEERKITVERSKYNSIEDANPPQMGEIAELSISSIVFGARCALPQVKKIVKLHNRAIANNGLENGFQNLWSILEVICVSNPNSSKIEQVKSITVPILQRDYLSTYFTDISDNLKRALGQTIFDQFVSECIDCSNDAEKTACLILLPEHERKLDTLTDMLIAYPVLRSRILNLHDDCHNRNDLNNYVMRYAQRVSWHLYRLYRARNSIVHSGKRPDDLKDLGEHLHTYVDSVAREVIIKLCTGTLCHTSNVLIDSELQQEKWDAFFKEPLPISLETIKFIFSSQLESWSGSSSHSI